jgi:hypothetical protein
MRNLMAEKKEENKKIKAFIHKMFPWMVGLVCVALFISAVIAVIKINGWFETHRFVFHSPIEISYFQPVKVEERKPQVITINNIISYPGEIDTPIKKYICDKFGPYDCKIALAIVAAESNFNDQAIHVNDNGTVDLGCWQINFPTHKGTISPIEALDCKKATDWAFDKKNRDGGYGAWATFNNGSFKNHI